VHPQRSPFSIPDRALGIIPKLFVESHLDQPSVSTQIACIIIIAKIN
jgi:hypothetical protein